MRASSGTAGHIDHSSLPVGPIAVGPTLGNRPENHERLRRGRDIPAAVHDERSQP